MEIGAYDGVTYSNTKFFEDTFKWKGLLIEANPNNYKNLVKNRPNTKKLHAGVCPKNQTSFKFGGDRATGGDITQ